MRDLGNQDDGLYDRIPLRQRKRFGRAFFYIAGVIFPPLVAAVVQLERARSCFNTAGSSEFFACVGYLPVVENWIIAAVVAAFGLFLVLPLLFWDG